MPVTGRGGAERMERRPRAAGPITVWLALYLVLPSFFSVNHGHRLDVRYLVNRSKIGRYRFGVTQFNLGLLSFTYVYLVLSSFL